MRPTAFFFDIGGTLATAMDATPRRLLGTRLNLSEKETKRVGRLLMTEPSIDPQSLAEAVCGVLPHKRPGEILGVIQTLWLEQMHSVRAVPGAKELLESLGRRGGFLGILSNTWFPLFQGFCNVFAPVTPLLRWTVLSFQEGFKKPSREIFLRAILRSGLPPCSCWMVGDSYELDMEPAMDVGMKTLWVLFSPERERDLLDQVRMGAMRSPDGMVRNIEEARRLLENNEDISP